MQYTIAALQSAAAESAAAVVDPADDAPRVLHEPAELVEPAERIELVA